MKDVGMFTCKLYNPCYTLACLFAFLHCHPYFIHILFNNIVKFFILVCVIRSA